MLEHVPATQLAGNGISFLAVSYYSRDHVIFGLKKTTTDSEALLTFESHITNLVHV